MDPIGIWPDLDPIEIGFLPRGLVVIRIQCRPRIYSGGRGRLSEHTRKTEAREKHKTSLPLLIAVFFRNYRLILGIVLDYTDYLQRCKVCPMWLPLRSG